MKIFLNLPVSKNSGLCGHGGISGIDARFPRPLHDFKLWAQVKSGLAAHLPMMRKTHFIQSGRRICLMQADLPRFPLCPPKIHK